MVFHLSQHTLIQDSATGEGISCAFVVAALLILIFQPYYFTDAEGGWNAKEKRRVGGEG